MPLAIQLQHVLKLRCPITNKLKLRLRKAGLRNYPAFLVKNFSRLAGGISNHAKVIKPNLLSEIERCLIAYVEAD